ncbi:hypothetical protein [Cedecea neteri]|nr:hypothetical protein [Cedecea neteri]
MAKFGIFTMKDVDRLRILQDVIGRKLRPSQSPSSWEEALKDSQPLSADSLKAFQSAKMTLKHPWSADKFKEMAEHLEMVLQVY